MFTTAVPYPCKADLDADATNELLKKFIKDNRTTDDISGGADSDIEEITTLEVPSIQTAELSEADMHALLDEFDEYGFGIAGFDAITDYEEPKPALTAVKKKDKTHKHRKMTKDKGLQ